MENGSRTPTPRKSYNREFKLRVVEHYKELSLGNTKNRIIETAKFFGIDESNVRRWIKSEIKLQETPKGSKSHGSGRKSLYPEMERQLHREFKEIREDGLKAKSWWFKSRAAELADSDFKCSSGWFKNFKKRHNISYRAPTSGAQNPPDAKIEAFNSFHKFIRKNASRDCTDPNGRFKLVANMDQSPLPFDLNKGKTYETTGATKVWCRTKKSGLDYRQATLQCCIFSDGVKRIKPLVIFRGTGQRIPFSEKVKYDSRVVVQFQQNAWCDEQVMLFWINNMWKTLAIQYKPTMLVADVHRAQNTETVKSKFREIGTTLALIPGGCTSELQPLDRVFHAPLKKKIEEITDKHVHANRKQWLEGTFTASERRILMTKWVGEAWSETCKEQTAAVVKCFKSCGISNKTDGSEDHLIHFTGIDNYTFEPEKEETEDTELSCFILNKNGESDSDEDIPLAELKFRV